MHQSNSLELTVIIVNYNTANLLPQVIDSLELATRGLAKQVIIVDNASRDDSAALLKRDFSDCRLIFNDSNVGFGRANNQGLPSIRGGYVLLLNTDAFVSADTVSKTIDYMEAHSSCGILGVKLIGRDGTLQPSCRYFPTPWNIFLGRTGLAVFFKFVRMVDDMAWDHASIRECDWVPGCYYLIRREVIDQVGLFDPRYFLYYEEVDHCFAAKKAGWQVHFFSDTSVVHLGGESAKSEGELTESGRQLEALQIESEFLYFRKNHGLHFVVMDLLLLILADVVLIMKRLLKLKFPLNIFTYMRHSFMVCTIFFRTKAGALPTR